MIRVIRRRCAHPEVMADTLYAWPPGTEVTWHLDAGPANLPATLTAAQALSAVALGLSAWPPVCGVKVRRVDDPAQARLLIRFGAIDGPYGVLGETELPAEGRADVQHAMLLDCTEPWTPDYLRMVVEHEGGHGIGLGHAPAGVSSVMSAFYDPAVTGPQPWEVAEARARYGPPASTPDPAPPSTPTAPPDQPGAVRVRFHADAAGDYELVLSLNRL